MSERLRQFASKEPYLSYFESILKPETKKGYMADLARISDGLGKPVHEANQEELEQYILAQFKRGLKGSTLSRAKASLAHFFKYEILKKHRLDDPSVVARNLKTGRSSVENPKALPKEKRQQVLDSINWEGDLHEHQMGLAILLTFKLGFRRFEVAKLQWSDIDYDEGMVRVVGKGREESEPDYVPLSPTITERLKVYKMIVDKAGIDSRWVFFRNKGGPWKLDQNKHTDKENIYKWFKQIGKRCGFGKEIKWSPHVGRHVAITTMYEKNVKEMDQVKISRHKNVAMLQKYTKRDDTKIKSEAIRAFE